MTEDAVLQKVGIQTNNLTTTNPVANNQYNTLPSGKSQNPAQLQQLQQNAVGQQPIVTSQLQGQVNQQHTSTAQPQTLASSQPVLGGATQQVPNNAPQPAPRRFSSLSPEVCLSVF